MHPAWAHPEPEAQPMKRSNETMEPICMVCKGPLSIDTAYKSNSWWKETVGVRVLLCSPQCVLDYAGYASMSAIADTE
jgi:hypothetical protein